VTVDLVIFTIAEDTLKVLLIRRDSAPFAGKWALPGGFVGIDESLSRRRRVNWQEEAGVANLYLEQLYTFGDPGRDPRGRVISVAYFALIDAEQQRIVASSDATDAALVLRSSIRRTGGKLAFDHRKILEYAVWRLRKQDRVDNGRLRASPEEIYPLGAATGLRDHSCSGPVDKRNFREEGDSDRGSIRELNETRNDGAHRPARLYSFRKG
jgi:8-oxo-dGTP diphosphatase